MTDSGTAQQKLRVCFFIPDFCYGGAQKQCILLLNELQCRDDIELTLIRFRAGAQDPLLDTSRIRSEYVDVRSNFDLRAIVAVGRLVSQCQADIIVSWVRVCDVYSCLVRLLHPRIKWVMTQRNTRDADYWLDRVRDLLGRRADAIAANSPAGVQRWAHRNTRGRVNLVDNIAAPVHDAPLRRVARSVLFVGRLETGKNVLVMVRAFASLAQTQPDVTIWVCGDGEMRTQMESIVAEAGVTDRIEFLGFRSDVPEWMQRAKILVSLSEHEGMPNVLMEGVQAGCTIVASSIPEHVSFLGAKYPFLVQNHHDVDEVAGVLGRALNAQSGSEDSARARQHLARMEPATVAACYIGIFRAVVARDSI
jgi:glycosyltransferase involved in cell wall biosynthesis